jgi:Flp pilus assembly protein TadG
MSFHRANRIWRLRQDEGQNLIEYAVVLIFTMLMLFGIMDFGRALYAYHFVSYAAREATRWAAVNGASCADDSSCNGGTYTTATGTFMMNSGPASPADIQNYVTGHLVPPGINPAKVTAVATFTAPPGSPASCPSNNDGCTVEVHVQYVFNFVAPIISTATVTMSSTSEMVIAH